MTSTKTINFDEIECVWLDLDDTLIDFKTNAHTVLIKLFKNFDLGRWWADADTWSARYEHFNIGLWDDYARGTITREKLRADRFLLPFLEAGADVDTATDFSRRFDTLYLDYLAQEKELMPGAIELLDSLKAQGFKIGTLSNGFKEVQHRKIERAGLTSYFDFVVLSDDIGVNKPDRRIFDYAASVASTSEGSHNLMIGDNPSTDISGALNAGWHAIWLDSPRCNQKETPTPPGSVRVNSNFDIISLLGSR